MRSELLVQDTDETRGRQRPYILEYEHSRDTMSTDTDGGTVYIQQHRTIGAVDRAVKADAADVS
jgi:hypothetical protein